MWSDPTIWKLKQKQKPPLSLSEQERQKRFQGTGWNIANSETTKKVGRGILAVLPGLGYLDDCLSVEAIHSCSLLVLIVSEKDLSFVYEPNRFGLSSDKYLWHNHDI
jgi:hypothetical protein